LNLGESGGGQKNELVANTVHRGFFLGSLFLGVLFLFFAATTSTAFSGDGTWLRSSASMA